MTAKRSQVQKNIYFIGAGNMAQAIIGAIHRNLDSAVDIHAIEPQTEIAARLTQNLGIKVYADVLQAPEIANADIVIWALKPQDIQSVIEHALPVLGNSLHLSIAAGVTTKALSTWLQSQRIVRAMPNMPALVAHGMTGLFASHDATTEQDRQFANQILSATGKILWVEREELLDAVTAISGSGPAYVFYFLEAMRQAGIDMGLSEKESLNLAVQTFSGAVYMVEQTDKDPSDLRESITSKGGTTHAALSCLNELQVQKSFIKAMKACQKRAAEMGRDYS